MNSTTPASGGKSDAATPAETREYMTKLSGRGYAQFRHILVQLPEEGQSRASTLARMVTGRRHRELLLYLLLVSCWNWLEENHEPLAAATWIRALTSKDGVTWSPSTLSRSWKRLEELGLIEERKRDDRLVRVVPRREDGAEAYTAPGGRKDRWNTYFVLPDEFWTQELFAKLSLPALAVLLVVAKETSYQDECWFTYNRMDDWYGLKSRSVQTGVNELRELGLLMSREEPVKAPLSPTGKTVRTYYSLTGEFSYAARAARQKIAQREAQARERKKAAAPKVRMRPAKQRKKSR